MAPLYPDDLLPYFVAIHIAELIGIVALLRVTLNNLTVSPRFLIS